MYISISKIFNLVFMLFLNFVFTVTYSPLLTDKFVPNIDRHDVLGQKEMHIIDKLFINCLVRNNSSNLKCINKS